MTQFPNDQYLRACARVLVIGIWILVIRTGELVIRTGELVIWIWELVISPQAVARPARGASRPLRSAPRILVFDRQALIASETLPNRYGRPKPPDRDRAGHSRVS
jgi:hypothetical protein